MHSTIEASQRFNKAEKIETEIAAAEQSPEAFRQEIEEKSESEVSRLKTEGKQGLEMLENRASTQGLEIDGADKRELEQVGQEADTAKAQVLKKVQPGFMKEFSQEKRSELAGTIKKERREKRELREKQRQEVERLNTLKKDLSELSATGAKRFRNYFKIRKLENEISELEEEKNAHKYQYNEADRSSHNEKMQQRIAGFCKAEEGRWEAAPYEKEEVARLFSEEHLASLSLDDYAALLKRFPSEMVTHVTRQGIRDHTGQMWHTGGTDSFHNGFTGLVEDGRLRSHWGRHFVQHEKNKAVAEALQLGGKRGTREKSLKYLDEITDISGENRQRDGENYADYNAVHVAAEEVADEYYGAERGNEVFFAFPSQQIASQYYFKGTLNSKDGKIPNDQWIWTNENKGIDINSGIVFIPKDAMVSPRTGSKYEVDESGNVVEDEERKKVISEFIAADDCEDFLRKALAAQVNPEAEDKFEDIEKLAIEKFNMKDERLRKMLLAPNFLEKALQIREKTGSTLNIAVVERWLYYKEAQEAISSQEYWERYFQQHPGKKPSKIVYYEGGDPTGALTKWKQDNGLEKKDRRSDMGFSEREKSALSDEANLGIERFKSLAKEVIENYFALGTVFEEENYSPENLISIFKKQFPGVYEKGVETDSQFDTLEKHALAGIRLIDKYYGDKEFPGGFDRNMLRVFYALHDTGKPEAIEKETKEAQHKYTMQAIEKVSKILNIDQKQKKIMLALVSEDPIGRFLTNRETMENAGEMIREMAKSAEMEVSDFFELVCDFYKVDVGTYTEEFVGHSTNKEYIFDTVGEGKQLDYTKFSPKIKLKIDSLKNYVMGEMPDQSTSPRLEQEDLPEAEIIEAAKKEEEISSGDKFKRPEIVSDVKEERGKEEVLSKENIEKNAKIAEWLQKQLDQGGIQNSDELIDKARASLSESGADLIEREFAGKGLEQVSDYIKVAKQEKKNLEAGDLNKYKESLETASIDVVERMAKVAQWLQKQMESGEIYGGEDVINRTKGSLSESGSELMKELFSGKSRDYVMAFVDQTLATKEQLDEMVRDMDRAA